MIIIIKILMVGFYLGGFMSVAILGGLDRLKATYEVLSSNMGINAHIYNQMAPNLAKRIGGMDAIIIFTGTISHSMVRPVVKLAKNRNIPVVRSHTSSVSALKRCLSEAREGKQ